MGYLSAVFGYDLSRASHLQRTGELDWEAGRSTCACTPAELWTPDFTIEVAFAVQFIE
jgi:hypothetical protein